MKHIEEHMDSLVSHRGRVIADLYMRIDEITDEIRCIEAAKGEILALASEAVAETDEAKRHERISEVIDWLAALNGVNLHPAYHHSVADRKRNTEYRAKVREAFKRDEMSE